MSRVLCLAFLVVITQLLSAQQSATNPDPNTPRPIEALDTVWVEETTWTLIECSKNDP